MSYEGYAGMVVLPINFTHEDLLEFEIGKITDEYKVNVREYPHFREAYVSLDKPVEVIEFRSRITEVMTLLRDRHKDQFSSHYVRFIFYFLYDGGNRPLDMRITIRIMEA